MPDAKFFENAGKSAILIGAVVLSVGWLYKQIGGAG